MPEKAIVFIAEDKRTLLDIEKRILSDEGHTVVLEAQTLDEARENVKIAKERGVNVAVLDGSLSEPESKDDGKVIAKALREAVPGIQIISCSLHLQDWSDTHLAKENAITLGGVVTKL